MKTMKRMRLLMLWIALLAGGVQMHGADVVLSEDFSGDTNIFGITATGLTGGKATIYDSGLSGFGRVLAVCNATAEGTIASDGQPIDFSGKVITLEWDAFHGYLSSGRTTTVSLQNSDGKELVSYVYNSSGKVTGVKVAGQDIAGFEAFGLQNQNGFGGNGKPYGAMGNPHIAVSMTTRGAVTVAFSKSGKLVKRVVGSLGALTQDVAGMKIDSKVDNADRCYAIDNITVTTEEMALDPNYVEDMESVSIVGANKMTFGPNPDTAADNTYSVRIVGTDGTLITEDNKSEKVSDFRVTWDIEGFQTANDNEGQYCDSYGAFAVNGQGKVATNFLLRNVPMNFYGCLTATVTYHGKTLKASKYVVALGNAATQTSQVLPWSGYPADFSSYPDALVGYQLAGETYGAADDLIVGGWSVAGSDSHQATIAKDADGTKYVRLTASTSRKSHVLTQSIASPGGQLIFKSRLRFNNAGAMVTLTGGYPFWASSRYTCPVSLSFDGKNIKLNGTELALNDAAATFATGNWYDIVLSADKSTETCYAMVCDAEGNLLGQTPTLPWAETSSPTYFSIGMGNENIGSVDIAACEAYVPTIDADSYLLTADKTSVSIPANETASLAATVTDQNGYPITGLATWSILEPDMQQCITLTADAADSHKATLALTEMASAGEATVQVSIGGAVKTLAVSLVSTDDAIKFVESTTSITIPLDAGQVATATFKAQLVNGAGKPYADAAVTLAAYDRSGMQPYTFGSGITFDAATGQLAVEATAQPCQFTIRATARNSKGDELSKSIGVNVHGLKFDFGQAGDAAVAEGFTEVGTATTYTAANGYGIKSGTATAGGTASTTDATADYLEGAIEFDFKATVGDFYEVEITYQGTLTTGYINGDLAGYELGSSETMTTATLTIPATVEIIDLRIADTSKGAKARIAQISITKQAKRQKRQKRVVHHIGDSTSANNGSWAYRLARMSSTYSELFALCNFQNNGAGGRNLCTYYAQGKLYNVLKDIYPGDIVMFGNNGTNGMGNSFEADMNYYLDAAEALGAQIIINSYTPHGAVSNYSGGYNAATHTFDSYRRDSYETIVRRVSAEREASDDNYLGFVEIGQHADAAFNAYVADYAKNGYASADAAAQAIITCFTDHNHYSNGTLAGDLMLNGYGTVEGIVAQLTKLLSQPTAATVAVSDGATLVNNGIVNNEIYNLSGQRVARVAKGLYIIGGRKVVVR